LTSKNGGAEIGFSGCGTAFFFLLRIKSLEQSDKDDMNYKTETIQGDLLHEFIRQAPAAELHLHLEGTLEPELAFLIGERNGITLPYKNAAALKAAYQFTNLQSFLDIYNQGCDVLIHRRDFYDLTWAYLEKAHQDNLRHVEVFFDPQHHTGRGISFETVITGIHDALEQGRERFGVTWRLIPNFLRHLSAESAMETLQEALPYRAWILGFGLDSSENGNPPDKFKEVFEQVLAEGFLSFAHAGEEGPPAYIWQAVTNLKVTRIDHGNSCLLDSELMDLLAERRIPLTVCPLSNLKLKVVKSLKEHRLRELLAHKICATLHSDDPSYFGGYIKDNFVAIQEALDLSFEEIVQLLKNGFEASCIPDAQRLDLFAELDQHVAAFRQSVKL
jgi:adenosine deaminase